MKVFYVGCTKNDLDARLCGHIIEAKNYNYEKWSQRSQYLKGRLILDILKKKQRPIIALLERTYFFGADSVERKYYLKFVKMGYEMHQRDSSDTFSYVRRMEATALTMRKKGEIVK